MVATDWDRRAQTAWSVPHILAMAKTLEELPVYHKAEAFAVAVNALLERPAFGRNRRLYDQLTEASDSMLSNMSEGFEQPTDRAMEKYLFHAKGSAAEMCRRLASAQRRGYITAAELATCRAMGKEVGRMLGGWIRYLARCDWKDRGRHNLDPPSEPPDSDRED